MKKFLAIALTVVMVLGVASSALAFDWSISEKTDEQKFGYKVEVLKFTRSTGSTGSSSFNIDNNATAVNGADVYFAVRVTVPDLKATDVVRVNAELNVVLTGIRIPAAATLPANYTVNISALPAGVYYLYNDGGLRLVSHGNPVFSWACADTDTAKITAKITSERPLPDAGSWFTYGDYNIYVNASTVEFWDGAAHVATFNRNSDGKVTSVDDAGSTTQAVIELYKWLNAGSADAIYAAVKDGKMYMTNGNIRAAFGWSYKTTSEISWNANSTPIILDPNVSIPKTGDNASVIGFAMIMVALVAAVAVKKVKA